MSEGGDRLAAVGRGQQVEALAALEQKLAAAVGPDRDLDQAIAEGIGLTIEYSRYHEAPMVVETSSFCTAWVNIPHYSGSIDAALTLMPDCWWKVERMCDGGYLVSTAPWGEHIDTAVKSTGPTEAIARSLAATRARRQLLATSTPQGVSQP